MIGQLPDQPKKMLTFHLLEILKRYTDEDHRLSQKEIGEILKRDYDMKADRKSIRRNLLELQNYGYEVNYTETTRMMPFKDPKSGKKKMKKSTILSDFYLEREFTNSELRLLIDSLLFSKHISSNQCNELIEKLAGLSNNYFKSHVRYLNRLPNEGADNRELFLNIELLDEAINERKKVSFQYLEYRTDKQLHTKQREDGSERIYIISPYQMAIREGKYYLICNYDKYNDVSNYRLDRIANLKILDEAAKPFESLKWAKGARLNLKTYMQEHPYMYASDNIFAKLHITKPMIGEVIDTFGKGVMFSDEDKDGITVSLTNNAMAIEEFVKRYMPDVVVLKPERLRNNIKKYCRQLLKEMEEND